MWKWLRRRASKANPGAIAEPAPSNDDGRMAGKYRALHRFLESRYSNTVVLTFGQIEDLLGFSLPDRARIDREWWTTASSTAEPQHSQAWAQASMTAIPNLLAKNVIFERSL